MRFGTSTIYGTNHGFYGPIIRQAYCGLPLSSTPTPTPTPTAADVILELANSLSSLLNDKESLECAEEAEDSIDGEISDYAKAILFCLAELMPIGSDLRRSRGKGKSKALLEKIKSKHTEVMSRLCMLCIRANGSAGGSAGGGNDREKEKSPNQVLPYHIECCRATIP